MDRGMNRVSTHVLDTARGKPAAGVPVRLDQQDSSGQWSTISAAQTDQDGRCAQLATDGAALAEGVYRLTFDTASYFAASKQEGRSEEHTSELQSQFHLVCRLLLEKK